MICCKLQASTPGMEGADTKRQRACPSCPCVWILGMKPCAAAVASWLSARPPSSATRAPASCPSQILAAAAGSSASACRAAAAQQEAPGLLQHWSALCGLETQRQAASLCHKGACQFPLPSASSSCWVQRLSLQSSLSSAGTPGILQHCGVPIGIEPWRQSPPASITAPASWPSQNLAAAGSNASACMVT